MPKPEDKNISNKNEEEISKLREIVLKWVEAKKEVENPKKVEKIIPKSQVKITPKPYLPTPAESKTEIKAKTKKEKKIKTKLSVLAILILAIIFVLLVVAGVGLYYQKFNSPATELITRIIPYPVAIVNFQPISYYQWHKQTQALINFYQREKTKNPSLIIPTLAETQTHILERMINEKIIEELANKYNLSVTNTDLDEGIKELSQSPGIGNTEILSQQLMDLYNWSLVDFKKEIIKPLLLKNKVEVAVASDERVNQQALNKAKEILAKINNGESFEELARKYSGDISALQGGDLGYFSKGQMIPEFEKVAFTLNSGEVSDIVKTKLGYHIIQVIEKLVDENNEVVQIRARQILIPSKKLDDYLAEIKKQGKIWLLIKI